mmetsp:Transcript_3375/g.7825  ORF Transcript_3375/g.7825 Transcript_3375/m.7825 type:complete len:303 (+) Transcript_3375:220-1128(+)
MTTAAAAAAADLTTAVTRWERTKSSGRRTRALKWATGGLPMTARNLTTAAAAKGPHSTSWEGPAARGRSQSRRKALVEPPGWTTMHSSPTTKATTKSPTTKMATISLGMNMGSKSAAAAAAAATAVGRGRGLRLRPRHRRRRRRRRRLSSRPKLRLPSLLTCLRPCPPCTRDPARAPSRRSRPPRSRPSARAPSRPRSHRCPRRRSRRVFRPCPRRRPQARSRARRRRPCYGATRRSASARPQSLAAPWGGGARARCRGPLLAPSRGFPGTGASPTPRCTKSRHTSAPARPSRPPALSVPRQ